MTKMRLMIALLGVCVLLSPCVFADQILINGDFETGDLTGWDFNTVNAIVTGPTTDVTPFGDYMAALAPLGIGNALLGQQVSTVGYSEATVSFQYNLWSRDLPPESGPDYFAFFAIGAGGLVLDVVPVNVARGLAATTTGWLDYSRTFTDIPQGDFFLGFGLANGGILDIFLPGLIPGDVGAGTRAYLDNVSIDATPVAGGPAVVPEPGAFLLLGTGLLGMAVISRSKGRLSFLRK